MPGLTQKSTMEIANARNGFHVSAAVEASEALEMQLHHQSALLGPQKHLYLAALHLTLYQDFLGADHAGLGLQTRPL